jgi:DNA polymerase-3 subunit alpha
MAALLSNEIHNTDKIGVFVSECHRMGIEILPPDLNASQLRFSPEVALNGIKGIRYGLAAIKNCGEGAMAAAIADREQNGAYSSLDDFSARLDSKVVNKRILENLVKAGALDWTGETRAGMFNRLEQVVASASSAQRDRASGQVSLFDSLDFAPPPAAKSAANETPVEEWSKDDRLAHEKELLGFYVTGHPLDKFRGVIDSERYKRLGLLEDLDISNPRERFPFAGMIRSLEARITKTGKPFGILQIEDFTGSAEVMLWGETFSPARESGLLEAGKIIKLKCAVQVDDRTGGRKLTGYEIAELKPKRASSNGKGPLELLLWTTRHSEMDLLEIRNVLAKHPGPTPVLLHFQNSAGRRATVAANESYNVKRCEALEAALDRWLED